MDDYRYVVGMPSWWAEEEDVIGFTVAEDTCCCAAEVCWWVVVPEYDYEGYFEVKDLKILSKLPGVEDVRLWPVNRKLKHSSEKQKKKSACL